MSTKASPPATSSPSSTSSSIPIISTTGVKIKKEIANDEIKDFAETAMNELLGWYGYDNVDLSTKTSRLMTRNLHNHNRNNNELNGIKISNRDDSNTSDRDSSREDSKSPCSTKTSEKLETNCGWCRRIVPENSPEFLTTTDGPHYCSESCFAQSRRASFKRAKQCDWCRHIRHAVSYVDFQDGASQLQFCSDKCLNQYKMQIFCKETQAHLDMNPHLKEKLNDTTQSGSLITPELWLKNCRSRSISPASDVSRSPTPSTANNSLNNSIVSGPQQINSQSNSSLSVAGQQNPHKPLISVAPVSKLMSKAPNKNSTATISNMTTTPTTSSVLNNRQSPGKHGGRKKRSNITTRSAIMQQMTNNNNNNQQTNNNNNNLNNNNLVNSSNNKSNKILLNSLNSSTNSAISKTYQNVKDLRLNIPSISPNDLTVPHAHHQQHLVGRQNIPLPPHQFFSHSPGPNNYPPQMRPPFLSPPPPPSSSTSHHHAFHSRLMGSGMSPIHHQLPPQTQPRHLMPNDMINPLAALIGSTPPITVMVPYPIILPIPIPIPLPIIDFLRAANLSTNNNNSNEQNDNKTVESRKENSNYENERNLSEQKLSTKSTEKSPINTTENQDIERIFNCSNDEPLDFTKSNVTKIIEENLNTAMENEKKFDENLNKSIDDDEISNSPLTDKNDLVENRIISTVTNLKLIEDVPKNENDNCTVDETQENNNVKQKVPKFKITRLHTKRLITTTTKELECNRPLRKRKRIIDCYVTSREGEKDECSKVKK